jgi:hypothetical protein
VDPARKSLQKGVNGLETEGPQTTEPARGAPPDGNVVRLWDWIGPREKLVPLGTRASAAETDLPPPSAGSPPEEPPSAADFWGERAAAIHHALQSPARGNGPKSEPASPGAGTAAAVRGGIRLGVRPPALRTIRRALGARVAGTARRGRGIAVVVGTSAAVAASASIALNLTGPGSPTRHLASKVDAAAELGGGVSGILDGNLRWIDPSLGRGDAAGAMSHRARSDSSARSPKATRSLRHQSARERSNSRAARARSTPVSRVTATSRGGSEQAASTDNQSASASARDSTQQAAPVQQTPPPTQAQQPSEQQPVHYYQPPPQPAGPGGLGSQVGGDCNPKCS